MYVALWRNNNQEASIISGKRRRRRNSSNDDDFPLANYDGPLYYSVKELTKDHHPDREDERRRVEAAGGFVLEWAGVYRVNGELALSRAIGDMPFKRLVRIFCFAPSIPYLPQGFKCFTVCILKRRKLNIALLLFSKE
jgi:hypothetical protein